MLLNALLVVGAVLLLAQVVMLWRFTHVVGTIRRYEARLGHVGDTMTLLTETLETGFRAMALEIERLASADAPRADSARQRDADGHRRAAWAQHPADRGRRAGVGGRSATPPPPV